jgi:hypothetical protein
MSSPLFSLEEDLLALSEILPTTDAISRIRVYLQRIQTAPSREHLQKLMDRVAGYLEALDDTGSLSSEQAVLMRELVTRARLRCTVE